MRNGLDRTELIVRQANTEDRVDVGLLQRNYQELLAEKNRRIEEMSSQLVHLSSGESGYEMKLTAGQEITVTHDGNTVTAKARNETVADLLDRLHITPSPLEMVDKGDVKACAELVAAFAESKLEKEC